MWLFLGVLAFLVAVGFAISIVITLLEDEEEMKEQKFCYSENSENGECMYETRQVKKNTCYNTSKSARNGRCTCSTFEVPC